MTEYRTPREDQAKRQQEAAIQKVLDQAVHDGVSVLVAMTLREPAHVVEQWVNAFWDGLRDNLSDNRPEEGTTIHEDRLAAIAMLLEQRMRDEAEAIVRSVRDVAS